MSFLGIVAIALGALFSNNIVFSNALGISPFLSKSENFAEALIAGISITVMTSVCALFTSLVDTLVLQTLDITYLRSVVYVVVITLCIAVLSFVIKKYGKSLRGLPISLFDAYSNTVVFGVCLFAAKNSYNILESLVFGLFAGIGFTLAVMLFSVVRARLKHSKFPAFLEGLPMLLITAGLIALVFGGFDGMKFM